MEGLAGAGVEISMWMGGGLPLIENKHTNQHIKFHQLEIKCLSNFEDPLYEKYKTSISCFLDGYSCHIQYQISISRVFEILKILIPYSGFARFLVSWFLEEIDPVFKISKTY